MKILTAILLSWFLLACVTMPVIAQRPAVISIVNDAGKEYSFLAAGPVNSKVGVIVIHDWFGITDFTKESVQRLADKGARVVAVDLYKGKSAATHDDAKALQGSLENSYAQQSIKTAMQTLKLDKRRIVVIGYSAGAKFALRAMTENSETIHAAALIYGGGYEFSDARMLAKVGPILAVYGSEDQWSHKSFLTLQEHLDKLQKNVETYIYPGAGHAFAQKLFNNGENIDLKATQAMRHVLDGFLERVAFNDN